MANCRNKGHSFERKIAAELREIWPDCLTSRNGNPQADSAGLDLIGTRPFNFQLKAMERGPGYHSILEAMPQDENYNVILHKRNRCGVVVVLSWPDFLELLQILKRESII